MEQGLLFYSAKYAKICSRNQLKGVATDDD